MRESELYELEIICRDIENDGIDIFNWEWDHKFDAVLSNFPVTKKGKALSVLKRNFLYHFDEKKIKKAEANIKGIADALGGIRGGQLLFMSEPERNILMFGAWWPWNNQDKISIRLGLVTETVSNIEEVKLIKNFKSWFNL